MATYPGGDRARRNRPACRTTFPARSKSYRWSCNAPVLVRGRDLCVVEVLADGGYRGSARRAPLSPHAWSTPWRGSKTGARSRVVAAEDRSTRVGARSSVARPWSHRGVSQHRADASPSHQRGRDAVSQVFGCARALGRRRGGPALRRVFFHHRTTSSERPLLGPRSRDAYPVTARILAGPTASRKASFLSTRSQVKFFSERPKWP